MKDYFNDYKDLCNHCKQFYKDHWLGTLVLTTVGTVISFAPLVIPVVKEEIKRRKTEKDNSIEETESC